MLLALALAEPIRVSAAADPGVEPVQARQQALERAFAEAVFQTAGRLLPTPLPAARSEHLHRFLAPRATALVLSFQEVAPAKAPAPAPAEKTLPAPLALELDVEVNRAAISELLTRLGLLAGGRHPDGFALRLGKGVAEQDLKALEPVLALQGLTRAAKAPLQVSLERLPQGYFKGVLWQDAKSFVADGQDLVQLWLDLWGKYFSAREQQPGTLASPLGISGFVQADAALEFTKILQSWDDCLREVQLHVLDLRPGNSTAWWSARVTNPARLSARLQEQLPGRKLTAVR